MQFLGEEQVKIQVGQKRHIKIFYLLPNLPWGLLGYFLFLHRLP